MQVKVFQGEHSAILLTFIIKLPFVIKIFVLSIFEWPFYTVLTVVACQKDRNKIVETQISLLLQKQSDQCLPCLLF